MIGRIPILGNVVIHAFNVFSFSRYQVSLVIPFGAGGMDAGTGFIHETSDRYFP